MNTEVTARLGLRAIGNTGAMLPGARPHRPMWPSITMNDMSDDMLWPHDQILHAWWTIRLGSLKVLGAQPCTYDELKVAIDEAAAVKPGS